MKTNFERERFILAIEPEECDEIRSAYPLSGYEGDFSGVLEGLYGAEEVTMFQKELRQLLEEYKVPEQVWPSLVTSSAIDASLSADEMYELADMVLTAVCAFGDFDGECVLRYHDDLGIRVYDLDEVTAEAEANRNYNPEDWFEPAMANPQKCVIDFDPEIRTYKAWVSKELVLGGGYLKLQTFADCMLRCVDVGHHPVNINVTPFPSQEESA